MRREADTSGRGARGRAAGLRGALRALAACAVVALAAALALPAAAMAGGGQGGGAALVAGGAPALRASSGGEFYYLDRDGVATTVGEGSGTVSSSDRGATWGAGFHVVASDASIGGGVTCAGQVNLILCDGATLEVQNGIAMEKEAALHVYAGGASENIAGTGKLAVTGSAGSKGNATGEQCSGTDGSDGVNGVLLVYSGTVTVSGGKGGDGGGDGDDYTTYDNQTCNGGKGGDGVSGQLQAYGGKVTVKGGDGGNGGIGSHGWTSYANGGDGGAGVSGYLRGSGGEVIVNGGSGGFEGSADRIAKGKGGAGVFGGENAATENAAYTVEVSRGRVSVNGGKGGVGNGVFGHVLVSGGKATVNGGDGNPGADGGAGISGRLRVCWHPEADACPEVTVNGGNGGDGGVYDNNHGCNGDNGGKGGVGVLGELEVYEGGCVRITGGDGGDGGDAVDYGNGGNGGDGGDGIAGDLSMYDGAAYANGGAGGAGGNGDAGSFFHSYDGTSGRDGCGVIRDVNCYSSSAEAKQSPDNVNWTKFELGSSERYVKVVSRLSPGNSIQGWTYDGTAHYPVIKDLETGTVLTEGTNYTITYSKDGSIPVSEAKDAGNYGILVEGKGGTYGSFKLDESFTVEKRKVTFTGESQTKNYTGSEIEISTVSEEGLLPGHTHDAAFSAKGTEVGGPYKGSISAKDAIKIMDGQGDVTANYDIAVVNGALSVQKDPDKLLEVSLGGLSCDYDGKAHALPAEATTNAATGASAIEYSKDSNTWTADLSALTATNVSDSCTIQVRATNPNYANTAKSSAELTIKPKKATITVNGASKVQGKPNPTFSGAVEGLVAKDDLGEVTFVRTSTNESPGTYADEITAKYSTNANYDVTIVKGTFTIKALWSVVWLDGDGSRLDGKPWVEGTAEPAISKTPIKKADAQCTYAFTGWDEGSWDAAHAVKTYTPRFNSTKRTYTVRFVNADGTVLQSSEVAYGQMPKYTGKTPKKASTSKYTYKFKGWKPAISKVTGSAIYKATYSSTQKKKASKTPVSKMSAKGKTGIVIAWTKTKGAAGYDIFLSRCNHDGKKVKAVKVDTVEGNATFTWAKSGLLPRTSYKARVKAYAIKNGKKRYIGSSPLLHLYTSNGTKRYTNAKSVKVNKTKVSLKKGRSFTLLATVEKADKGKKLMPASHVAHVRYRSTNKSIATVTAGGKIKAKKKGTCYVYAYAHNGVYKKVRVEVG